MNAVVSVGYLTLLSYCVDTVLHLLSPGFFSYYPFPDAAGISAVFLTCSLLQVNITTLPRLMPSIMLPSEQTPYDIYS